MALFQQLGLKARESLTRSMCSTAEKAAEKTPEPVKEKALETYTKLTSQLHWLAAPAMIGCIGSVLICQQSPSNALQPPRRHT